MKRLFILLLTIIMILAMFPTTALGNDRIVTETDVEYFEDGSYIVTEITSNVISTMATKTTTKSKSLIYYDSNDNKEWRIVVTGTFNYTGSSANCTKSVTSYNIYNDRWKVTSAVSSKKGNKANGDFTVKRYSLGIPVKTVNKLITISCSNTGVCS
ncbi:MAG: hypothetical protein NC397_06475 [Clostridium sp.]|nr:hypothetical protein [Clostridium sp.]